MRNSLLLLIFIVTVSLQAKALPETNLPAFETTLADFYEHSEKIAFEGEAHTTIRGRFFHIESQNQESKLSVVILPGFSEPARKYAELIYDLTQAGHTVSVMDHRNQGESDRAFPCTECNYVDDYRYYIQDLKSFILNQVRPRSKGKKIIILAHSMGGGIATAALQDEPTLADAVILNSPMFQIQTGSYPEPVAQALAAGAVLAGKAKERRLFDQDREETLENDNVTHSVARWDLSHHVFVANPELYSHIVTNGWLHQAFRMTNKIRLSYRRLQIPVLMLQAGEDSYVGLKQQTKLCAYWKQCELENFPGSRHEILQEVDLIRDRAMDRIQQFLAQFVIPGGSQQNSRATH